MTSGTSWDLILMTFGGPGRSFLWFSGVLDMHWNFTDFQDHPKLRERGWWKVNCLSRASSNRSISPACWPLDCQTPVCWPVDHQIVIADGMLEEYLKYDISMNERITLTSDLKRPPSQPDGPWQAGAGGYGLRFRIIYFYPGTIGNWGLQHSLYNPGNNGKQIFQFIPILEILDCMIHRLNPIWEIMGGTIHIL